MRPAASRRVHLTAGAVTAGIVVLALLGPELTGTSPTAQRGVPYLPPGAGAGVLGTDGIGRDVLARVLFGGRDVVGVALAATAVSGVLAPLLGSLAALAAPRAGELLIRVLDVLTVLPALLVLLLLATGWPGSPVALVAGIALVSIPYSTRVIRAAVREVARSGYVEVARARGDSTVHLLRHDLLPGIARPLLADTAIRFVAAVHLSATAGFLGLGRGAPAAHWGRMVSDDLPGLELNPAAALAPALLLALLALTVGVFADALADRAAHVTAPPSIPGTPGPPVHRPAPATPVRDGTYGRSTER